MTGALGCEEACPACLRGRKTEWYPRGEGGRWPPQTVFRNLHLTVNRDMLSSLENLMEA